MLDTAVPDILTRIQQKEIKFVDLRFTDTQGRVHHLSVDAEVVNEDFLEKGKMFDGSSIAGWRGINNSDMILRPDLSTAYMDPFFEETTLNFHCDVIDPATLKPYERDPRAVARRAEAYLKSTGLGDTIYFGPEPEFFIFDEVQWENAMEGAFFRIDSESAAWNSKKSYETGNMGHRPGLKQGYAPVPPIDRLHDMRSAMCTTLKSLGLPVETHHSEVGSAGQAEINLRYNHLLAKADEMQIVKYVIYNVAHAYGKTVTFMPKPLAGDNGSGMHCHISVCKEGKNLFAGNEYAGLSSFALHFIGGIIQHGRALNAFTNPSTNSYKRLVPGFEAPVVSTYSACNRSASIRVPHVHSASQTRIEARFPDPLANPYLAFSALMLAGLDGVQRQLDPGLPNDRNLYELSEEKLNTVPVLCASLEEALIALKEDHAFLEAGGVFSKDLIEAYIELKKKEVNRMRAAPHPLEFEMYYSG